MDAATLYYDGSCGLCDWAVRWCLRHDRAGRLRYAPLQGTTFAERFPGTPLQLDSLVVAEGGRLYRESDAVLRLLRQLGRGWAALASVVRIVPRPIRDGIYRIVARHRKRWFGGAERCQLPRPGGHPHLLP